MMNLDFNKDVIMPALLIMIVYVGWSQGTKQWPQDSPEVKEKRALYSDAMKEGNYEVALEPLKWLLEHVPARSKSFYINGDKIYKELAKSSTDEALKRNHQDSRLALYDQRIKYFGDTAAVLNRKAYAAYKYYKNRPEKYPELFELFEQVIDTDPSKLLKANAAAYMYVLNLYKASGGEIDNEIILSRYDKISSIVQNHQLDEVIQRTADEVLIGLVAMNCDMINDLFVQPYSRDPYNLAKARQVVRLGLAYKCKSQPGFLQAAQVVFHAQPKSNLAYLIAKTAQKNGSYEEAEYFCKEAIRLAEENERKSEMYFSLANHYQVRDLKSKARGAALNSLAYNPSLKRAYKLIGDLYMSSSEICAKKKSRTEDRAVFIAAYDMYAKAEDKHMMTTAKQHFPSMEEIFNDVLEVGQTVDVGCWINEKVVLQTRTK